jgi:hypothetical protein
VLAARCPYFERKFAGDWSDGHSAEANFTEFSENPMREVMRYIYTGSLRVDVVTLMGVLRIASFLGLEKLIKDCKAYITNDFINAFDLCIMYGESRDFEEMRAFLSSIIPQRVEPDILCRVLKEIWTPPRMVTQEGGEERDLQEILFKKLQLCLPTIMEEGSELFELPLDCLSQLLKDS